MTFILWSGFGKQCDTGVPSVPVEFSGMCLLGEVMDGKDEMKAAEVLAL